MNEYKVKNDQFTWSVMPERSEWICYMFGATQTDGIRYQPAKGKEPNRFVRWMMKICFDCKWVKETK